MSDVTSVGHVHPGFLPSERRIYATLSRTIADSWPRHGVGTPIRLELRGTGEWVLLTGFQLHSRPYGWIATSWLSWESQASEVLHVARQLIADVARQFGQEEADQERVAD